MLALTYFTLSAYVIGFLYLIMNKGLRLSQASPNKRKRTISIALVSGIAWLTYVAVLIQSGILKDLELPPKFPLFILIPIIAFQVGFYNRHKNSEVIRNVPRHWLIYFQSFRVFVEIMLYYKFLDGIIPESATFEGYNFDIVMGAMAPIIALTLYRRIEKFRALAVVWNIVGMLMILLVAVVIGTSLYLPDVWGSELPLVSDQFVELPYFLIAAVIAPGAIFVHVISLIQLRQLKN